MEKPPTGFKRGSKNTEGPETEAQCDLIDHIKENVNWDHCDLHTHRDAQMDKLLFSSLIYSPWIKNSAQNWETDQFPLILMFIKLESYPEKRNEIIQEKNLGFRQNLDIIFFISLQRALMNQTTVLLLCCSLLLTYMGNLPLRLFC